MWLYHKTLKLSPPAISGLPKELMCESTLSYVWAPLVLAHQPFGSSLSKVSSKAEQRKNRTEGDSDPDICLHSEGFSPVLPYFKAFLGLPDKGRRPRVDTLSRGWNLSQQGFLLLNIPTSASVQVFFGIPSKV